MEMKRINAQGLKAAGYDERDRRLVVETSTGTFEYANISPEVFRRLMSSPTPGSYYRESIEEEFTPRRVK
ncbi:MAG: KTSC domain-containing protein [Usitatibacter sp.]